MPWVPWGWGPSPEPHPQSCAKTARPGPLQSLPRARPGGPWSPSPCPSGGRCSAEAEARPRFHWITSRPAKARPPPACWYLLCSRKPTGSPRRPPGPSGAQSLSRPHSMRPSVHGLTSPRASVARPPQGSDPGLGALPPPCVRPSASRPSACLGLRARPRTLPTRKEAGPSPPPPFSGTSRMFLCAEALRQEAAVPPVTSPLAPCYQLTTEEASAGLHCFGEVPPQTGGVPASKATCEPCPQPTPLWPPPPPPGHPLPLSALTAAH